jgi:hypothetical protein
LGAPASLPALNGTITIMSWNFYEYPGSFLIQRLL